MATKGDTSLLQGRVCDLVKVESNRPSKVRAKGLRAATAPSSSCREREAHIALDCIDREAQTSGTESRVEVVEGPRPACSSAKVEERAEERVTSTHSTEATEPPKNNLAKALDQFYNGGTERRKNSKGLGGSAIRTLLHQLVMQKRFSLVSIRRAAGEMLAEADQCVLPPLRKKPHASKAAEMFDNAFLFMSGKQELPAETCPIKAEAFEREHCRACDKCRPFGKAQADCYFTQAHLDCLRNGWTPPVSTLGPLGIEYCDIPRQGRPYDGNYDGVDLYLGSTTKEIDKMIDGGVLTRAGENEKGVRNSIGAVLKVSDQAKTLLLAGVAIVDQPTLNEANIKLTAMGLAEVKVRVITDCAASGLNAATLDAPFSNAGVRDALRFIDKGDFLIKQDVSRYFFSFSLAYEARFLFLISWLGAWYNFARCCFGFKLCPYYCSAWASEILKWLQYDNVPCMFMTDDWITSGAELAKARENAAKVKEKITCTGLSMNDKKYEEGTEVICQETRSTGSVLLFLGLFINTLRMVLSIDPLAAKTNCMLFEKYLLIIEMNAMMDATDAKSMAGKATWMCEVLQNGKSHSQSFHDYSRHLNKATRGLRTKVANDLRWWIGKLRIWSEGDLSQCEYPILSSSEILADLTKLYVLQSDASGPDGIGYIHGAIDCDDPVYVSKVWGDYVFDDSHDGELQALLDFVSETTKQNFILVWVTDSQSGFWSVNRGRCHEEKGRETLNNIFELADNKRIWLVALWLPRELNLLPDYLSHLSSRLNRDEVRGVVSELAREAGEGDQLQEEQRGGRKAVPEIFSAERAEPTRDNSSAIQRSSRVSVPVHGGQQFSEINSRSVILSQV